MTALIVTALLCQWPLPEPEAPTHFVCVIETIEVNSYTDYGGHDATQLLFWEQDRWDAKGKRFAVYKGYTRFSGAGLTLEDGKFVYRGDGSEYDVIEMRADWLVFTGGYDAERTMDQFAPVLKFPVRFRDW